MTTNISEEISKYILKNGKLDKNRNSFNKLCKAHNMSTLEKLLEEMKPPVSLKKKTRGKVKLRIPVAIQNDKRKSIALLWLRKYLKEDKSNNLNNKINNVIRNNNKILVNKVTLMQEVMRNRGNF